MSLSLKEMKASALIITTHANFCHNKKNIEVISGFTPYSLTYKYYSESKFICIPTTVLNGKMKYTLSGLTSFVDAAVMHKPVIISDNTNMGIDVEKLGIGFTYKAGDADDMRLKMKQMLSLSDDEYKRMCSNMANYSNSHNYDIFCKELVQVVSAN